MYKVHKAPGPVPTIVGIYPHDTKLRYTKYPFKTIVDKCIIVPETRLSEIISRTKPRIEIARPNQATSKPIVIINKTLITVSKQRKSFHSNLYFSVILKNCFTFSIVITSLSYSNIIPYQKKKVNTFLIIIVNKL